MDYKQAAREVAKGRIKPVYVCHGTESYLMQEFVRFIVDKTVEPDHKDLAIGTYDLAETPVADVLEDAQTLPFMVPTKVIVAQNAVFLTGAKSSAKVEHDPDSLLAYLDNPLESTVLILTADADKLDERKKVVKRLKALDAVLAFPALTPGELEQWVERQAERSDCRLTEEAASALILNCGGNLRHLASEIEKLSLYAADGRAVSAETVHSLVARSAEQNIFVLIDEIVKLRLEKAFAILHELLKQREEPIKIVSLIARQFRIMLQVKALTGQGFSQQQAASHIGVHPYAAKLAGEQAKAYEMDKLGLILSELADLDYRMKSGAIDKVTGLELFLLRLAS